MIHYRCPECDTVLKLPESRASDTETCPSCGTSLVVSVPSSPPYEPLVVIDPRKRTLSRSLCFLGILATLAGMVAVFCMDGGAQIPLVVVGVGLLLTFVSIVLDFPKDVAVVVAFVRWRRRLKAARRKTTESSEAEK